MEGENRIVQFWIQSQGYSIISNLNAGKNKIINILAFKKEIIKHIEVFVSISEHINTDEVVKKFKKPEIKKAIKKNLKKFGFKANTTIQPLLILNRSAIKSQNLDIPVHFFEDVLLDVFKELDQMNYPDSNLRILQIMKFIMLNQEGLTSKMISNVSSRKIKEEILGTLMLLPEISYFFSKKSNLKILENIFSNSMLFNPTTLANYLPNHYSKRSLNAFVKTLFENQKLNDFKKKRLPQQKPLTLFLE